MRLHCRAAVVGLATAIASVFGTYASAQVDAASRLDALFGKSYSAETPGCAVAVSNQGVIIKRAYGLADLERGVANTPDTVFESGSLAKQFTAMAVLLLERDGKLKTSDDIRKYLPEMPDYGWPVTIEHLLNHTSGLRDWGSVAAAAGEPRGRRVFTQADVLDILARQKSLNYKPGAEYSYTNSGYNLLAEIVARTSGTSFQAFTTERILTPLGMTHSQWRDDFNRVVKGRAQAYTQTAGGYQQSMPFMNVLGNGGLLTTVGDLLIWNDALTTAKLGAEVTKGMTKRGVLNDGTRIIYARGLEVQTYKGFSEISHSGSTAGYMTWLGRWPDQSLSVALLCNTFYPGFTFARRIADIFLPTSAAPVAESAAGSSDLARYAGLFADTETGMPLQVSVTNGGLRISGAPPLSQQGANHWNGDGYDVVFDGPDLFHTSAPLAAAATYKRMQPAQPTAAELTAYTGAYASDEAGASYKVTAEGGQLVLRVDREPEATARLQPAYRDAFTSGGRLFRFRRNAAGKVIAISLADNRMRDLEAPRTDPK